MKIKVYQEIMFFDWKIQLEKVQLTRYSKDDSIFYQGILLDWKNDQGYCEPTTSTQATVVWSPEDTCIIFQVAKYHTRMIKFHQQYCIESISFKKVNPDKLGSKGNPYKRFEGIENKVTRFQIFPETEVACKNNTPLYETQFSENLVGYKKSSTPLPNPSDESSYIPVTFVNCTGNHGGKLRPQDEGSTRLRELSLMNKAYFGAIYYDIYLDMKLDYTISRIFQENHYPN